MEADVVRSILAPSGTNLTMLIERATDLVKGYLRNSGYTPPTTQDPTTIGDSTVILATISAVRKMLCSMPSSSLQLPEAYATHPEQVAFVGILSGDSVLTLTRSSIAAVGGWGFTSTTSNPDKASRTSSCQLKGY
jgi:hypothetical protein